ncbi:hypothetical protein K438DRAFT_1833202 [Mycena galopus ATCC 62051]|nr:hypothetical protein K438DRAFT_1833202 [Mycena galopus ATCC 62051]
MARLTTTTTKPSSTAMPRPIGVGRLWACGTSSTSRLLWARRRVRTGIRMADTTAGITSRTRWRRQSGIAARNRGTSTFFPLTLRLPPPLRLPPTARATWARTHSTAQKDPRRRPLARRLPCGVLRTAHPRSAVPVLIAASAILSERCARTGAYLPISFLGTPIYFYFRVLHNGCTCGFALPRGDHWVAWVLRPEVVWGGKGFLFGSHDDGVGMCVCAFLTRAASGAWPFYELVPGRGGRRFPGCFELQR